jgi:iron(III) transport system ATP-binding protein
MSVPPAIDAEGIHKAYGRTPAVAGASVTVERGALVALLGPSGSGKTTMLRVIAGFEVPDAGVVRIGGHVVAGDGVWEEPERRRIGMVFQEGALFPHLTVAKNVGFGDAPPDRVDEVLALVGLADRGRSYPHELSGGERQRVALARALAPEPEVVLLDEPFASLDATLRVSLREEVARILRDAGASALLVTHDQQEALSLADVVTVMRAGRVEQTGTPEEVYTRPRSRWVAEFLGDAEVFPGTAADGVVRCELGAFVTDRTWAGEVEVVVRPETIALGAASDVVAPTDGAIPARVVARSYYGHEQVVVVELASGRRVRSRSRGAEPWAVDDLVTVRVCSPVTTVAAGGAPGAEAPGEQP